MNRELLSHLPVVIGVARHRGFAAAAAALNMSPSAVSHAVRLVEDRLGEPLFARTTRSVSLTESGRRFLASVGPALAEIDQTFEGLIAERGEVSGLLRINAPAIAMRMALIPILSRLTQLHPRLTVEIQTDDSFVDIVAEGFDAGVRLGASLEQDMVIARLTPPFKAVMVASPAYLEMRGRPKGIRDLAAHNCIGYRMGSGRAYEWELREGRKDVSIRTGGTTRVTDSNQARELALVGIGIAYLFEPLVRDDLRTGRLEWLLPKAAIEEDGMFLYYPRRASLAPKLRAFIEVARSIPD